jgi:hypothetical protein
MSDLSFAIDGATTAPYALVPTINFRLRANDASEQPIQSIQLRTQVRIEPERRRYTADEEERLLGLFGVPERWADTLQPFLWTHVTIPVGRFEGATEVQLPVECSYDLEVATGQYFHSLADGEIPLLFLFSGTVFRRGPTGTTIEQIDWDSGEARFRLPVGVWRETMDTAFPGSGWLRLQRETLDRLLAYKAARALPTWDATLDRLLDAAEVDA